jgi:outer membrane protein TolC
MHKKHYSMRFASQTLLLTLVLLNLGADASAASLNDFVGQIVSKHPRTAAAVEAISASESLVDAAKGAWLPQVSGAGQVGSNRSTISGGSNSGIRPGLSASQLVYDGGKADNNIKGREQDTLATVAQRDEVVQTLTARVTEAYLEWHRQNRLLALADEQLRALDRFDRMVTEIASFDKGRGSDRRLVTARIVQILNARDSRALSTRDAVMQIQQICACNLVPAVAPPQFALLMPEKAPTEAGRELLRAHPSVIGALARRDSTVADADAAAAWWKPTLEFQLSSQTEQDYTGKTKYFGLNSAMLNVRANVFDGNVGAAKEKSIRARARSAEASLDATVTELEAEANRHWTLISERKLRVASLKNLVEETDGAFDVVFEQFKLGRRSVIELLSYENERFAARGQVISEEMDIEVSRVRWLNSTGKLTEKLGVRG